MYSKLFSFLAVAFIISNLLSSTKSFALHAQNPFQKNHALLGDDMCQASVLFENLTNETKINPITQVGLSDVWSCQKPDRFYYTHSSRMDKAFPFQLQQLNYLCRTQKKLTCFNRNSESAFCLANLKLDESHSNYSRNFAKSTNDELRTQSVRPRFTHALKIIKSIQHEANGGEREVQSVQEWILDSTGCRVIQKIN